MPPIFYTPTAIVVGLICSYIGTLHCHLQIKKFTKTLNDSQLATYQNTKQRRLYYFISGVVIAIIGSILYLCLAGYGSIYHRIINALIILLLTPMIVYTLFPKSPYLLEQSDINNQETHDWFKIYVCMKNGMIYGFCVGFIASLIVLGILQLALI